MFAGPCKAICLKHCMDKVDAVIDTSLTPADGKRVQQLLYKYSDVFDETLSHTTLTTHKILTERVHVLLGISVRYTMLHRIMNFSVNYTHIVLSRIIALLRSLSQNFHGAGCER